MAKRAASARRISLLSNKISQYISILAIGISVVLLDLYFKSVADTTLNHGLALGIASGLNHLTLVTSGFVYLVLFLVFVRSRARLRTWILLLCILSLSNLYDRVVFGYVRDYIEFFGLVINLSDIAIVAVILVTVVITVYDARSNRTESHK